jgi:hypothetical protein
VSGPRTYDRLAGLPVAIEGYSLERLEQPYSEEFSRVTTAITLHGGGHTGVGEDVCYDAIDHDRMHELGAVHRLDGRWALDELSHHLGGLQLFSVPPDWDAHHDYRRWAFESAALDLALRQAGAPLTDVLDRTAAPLTFVTSRSLGTPPDATPVHELIDRVPGIRFKLDADPEWSDELIAGLAATGRVDTIDLKGHYEGSIVDRGADPELYRRIVEAFPDAWIEDPRLTAETRPIVEQMWDRVTWDAPLHRVGDITGLEVTPRSINVKPSRFGRLAELCDVYDHLERAGIAAYGGGQGELGPGRGQIQYLAAILHPEAPNDVAPSVYNLPEPPKELPPPPLEPRLGATGFRWAANG